MAAAIVTRKFGEDEDLVKCAFPPSAAHNPVLSRKLYSHLTLY
jgi:hypothetical protein